MTRGRQIVAITLARIFMVVAIAATFFTLSWSSLQAEEGKPETGYDLNDRDVILMFANRASPYPVLSPEDMCLTQFGPGWHPLGALPDGRLICMPPVSSLDLAKLLNYCLILEMDFDRMVGNTLYCKPRVEKTET